MDGFLRPHHPLAPQTKMLRCREVLAMIGDISLEEAEGPCRGGGSGGEGGKLKSYDTSKLSSPLSLLGMTVSITEIYCCGGPKLDLGRPGWLFNSNHRCILVCAWWEGGSSSTLRGSSNDDDSF